MAISLLIKILSVWGNNIPITYDQGRDLVDLRQMIVTHTPRLVGPTTSINGVLLGPFYYYFLLLPFIIFGGNPMALMFWQIIWFQISVVLLWLVLRKKSRVLANVVGILLSLLPTGFYTARYFWNANVMPIFTILFIAALIYLLEKRTLKRSFLVGFISGLSLQIEAAFGIIFFPFALVYLLFKRFPIKKLLALFIGFLITLLPQVLFELRHGFIMTKILFDQVTGRGDMLGTKLSLSERLTERGKLLIDIVRNTSHIPMEVLNIIYPSLIIFGIIYILKKKKNIFSDTAITISLFLFVFSCVFYLIFPMQVKGWYILSLTIPLVIFFAVIFEKIYIINSFGKLLVFLVILFTITNTLKAHYEYLRNNLQKPSNDPSSLINEIQAVDWVYQEANGEAFKTYSYLPAIYDYSFQYLFWWYGTKEYGYQPEEISYLPNQPIYIQNGELAWTKKKTTKEGTPVFLIIQGDSEHSERFDLWMGNFSKLCQVKEKVIIDSLKVSKLSSCSKQLSITK